MPIVSSSVLQNPNPVQARAVATALLPIMCAVFIGFLVIGLALPVLPLGAILLAMDRLPGVARSPFLSSYATGYLVTARKP